MWTPWIARPAHWLLNLLWPPRCALCRSYLGIDAEGPLCSVCKGASKPITPPYCPLCGRPFEAKGGENHTCGKCLTRRPPWDGARSLFFYSDTIRELIHALKFSKKASAIRALTYLGLPILSQSPLPTFDVIVPMPLSDRRLRERGFNQCLELGRAMFKDQRKRISIDALIKVKDTPPQSGLHREERKRNIRGAFVAKKDVVRDRKILLFDDIYTTGATSIEATRTLKGAGAKAVFLLTYARV